MLTEWNSKYFYGNEVSNYGQEQGFIDYATLAKSFEGVLNNKIISATGWENWEQESGFVDNSDEIEKLEYQHDDLENALSDYENGFSEMTPEEVEETQARLNEIESEIEELEEEQDEQPEIFQYFIVDDNGARILEEDFNEIVFYNNDLDMYVWGVTHWGTSWDYVLTDVKLNLDK